jgi:hypothetical protein
MLATLTWLLWPSSSVVRIAQDVVWKQQWYEDIYPFRNTTCIKDVVIGIVLEWKIVNPLYVHCTAVLYITAFICSRFIHSVFCLTTGPKPLPKQFLHIVWSRAFSFKWDYPLLSLRSSSSFLRLLPHLLVTSISPYISFDNLLGYVGIIYVCGRIKK